MSTHPSIEERLTAVGQRETLRDATKTVALAGMVGTFLRALHGTIWTDLWGSWERIYALLTESETKAFDWRGEYDRVAVRALGPLTLAGLVGEWLRGGPIDRPSIEREIRRLRRRRALYVAQLVEVELAPPANAEVSPERLQELEREVYLWTDTQAAVLPPGELVALLRSVLEADAPEPAR